MVDRPHGAVGQRHPIAVPVRLLLDRGLLFERRERRLEHAVGRFAPLPQRARRGDEHVVAARRQGRRGGLQARHVAAPVGNHPFDSRDGSSQASRVPARCRARGDGVQLRAGQRRVGGLLPEQMLSLQEAREVRLQHERAGLCRVVARRKAPAGFAQVGELDQGARERLERREPLARGPPVPRPEARHGLGPEAVDGLAQRARDLLPALPHPRRHDSLDALVRLASLSAGDRLLGIVEEVRDRVSRSGKRLPLPGQRLRGPVRGRHELGHPVQASLLQGEEPLQILAALADRSGERLVVLRKGGGQIQERRGRAADRVQRGAHGVLGHVAERRGDELRPVKLEGAEVRAHRLGKLAPAEHRQRLVHQPVEADAVGLAERGALGFGDRVARRFVRVRVERLELGDDLERLLDVPVIVEDLDQLLVAVVESVLDLADPVDESLRRVEEIGVTADDVGEDADGRVVLLSFDHLFGARKIILGPAAGIQARLEREEREGEKCPKQASTSQSLTPIRVYHCYRRKYGRLDQPRRARPHAEGRMSRHCL